MTKQVTTIDKLIVILSEYLKMGSMKRSFRLTESKLRRLGGTTTKINESKIIRTNKFLENN